jgi:peptidoglycan-N-acetylmuramic acid deacetylase
VRKGRVPLVALPLVVAPLLGASLAALLLAALVLGAVPSRALAAEWFFVPHGPHVRSGIPGSAARLVRASHAIWIGPRRHNVVYLTFDEGWEGGHTGKLLDELARAHVKATFFVTGTWVRDDPGLARRMAKAGHVVGDHTWSHPHMTALAGRPKAFAHQLTATAQAWRHTTGTRMAPFFRPPYGAYDARVLKLAGGLGYTTVFWSFAHVDYDTSQPPVSVTRARLIAAAYPGTLYLLHASSSSNVAALPSVIRWLKAHGYSFGTVDQLR